MSHSNKEIQFGQSEILLSTTELDSKIKYANPEFCNIAGFTLEELQGQTHNIVRHPDMPKAAFKDLWQYIQQGNSWMGPVKNRCKNGDYYWVNAYVTPIKDEQGKSFEYQSVRTKLDSEVRDRAEKTYQNINQGKPPRVLKFQTDMTMWFQNIFILLTLCFAGLMAFSSTPWLITIPLFILTFVSSILIINWRKHYSKLILEAKSVFNNPLMSYIYGGNSDVVGNIQLALNMRKAELNAVTGRVSDVALHVTDGANNTADATEQAAVLLAEQSNEIAQIATAMHEMTATVGDIARTVVNAAQAAEKGQAISQDGQKDVNETISAIENLSSQLNEVDKIIMSLIEGTSSISSVLTEISGIADQTNLLALNAAIEAARAGEQGRGFAVVADEVRALALRTQQSTEQINSQLTKLQSDSSNAVKAMKKGNELSDSCVTLSQKTGSSLNQIHAEISQLTDLNIQISTAIEEQAVVSEEVSRNIERISELSSTCEQQGQNAKSLVGDLLSQLINQQNLVDQFKGK